MNKGINAEIAEGATVQDVTIIVCGDDKTWENRQSNYEKIIGIL